MISRRKTSMRLDVTKVSDLSAAERIQLAQDLWDSVSDAPDVWMLSPEQKQELDRRLKAYRRRKAAGVDASSSWSEVKRRVLPSRVGK
jgi:putative addiction module component (TIGR02574 family)